MEAAIIGALLKLTLPKLWEVINEKRKLWTGGLVADAQSMQDELNFIRAAIKDSYGSHGRDLSHVQTAWIEQLRSLAYDIEDCIERFLLQIMCHGAKAMGKHGGQFAGEIRQLRERSKRTHEQLERYSTTGQGAACSSSISAMAPAAASPDHLVGITVPLEEIRELLLPPWETQEPRKIKVISIVGFGGLGKTLLARQVYNDKNVRKKFPLRAWVFVGGKSGQELIDEMTQQLQHAGARHVEGASATRRYLIVIDDVQETSQWDSIRPFFPSTEGSRVIVTTTIRSVAKHCRIGSDYCHVYNMRALGDEDSKELFFKTMNPDRSDPTEPESSALLKKCEGLPLALVSTAQFAQRSSEPIKSRYEQACLHLCADPKGITTLEGIQRVLVTNYNIISSHGDLQQCLLYFCMFPHGYDVRKNSLVRRLVAEGLVQDSKSAVQSLNALIDRSIIQLIQVGNNETIKRCKPHGMMLEYISHKSMSENFITVVLRRRDTESSRQLANQAAQVRRLSLQDFPSGVADMPNNLSTLRTLVVFNNRTTNNQDEEEEDASAAVDYEANCYTKLANCDLLRVLDMEQCNGMKNSHLREICKKFVLLKYLSLGGKSITKVPKEIENLELLETLDLRRSQIDTLPVQVIKLPHLKHLLGKFRLASRGSWDTNFKKKKKRFFTHLETLSGFVADDGPSGFPQLVPHMERLKKVKIWYSDAMTTVGGKDNLQTAITGFIRDGNHRPNDRTLSIDFLHLQDKSQADEFLNSLRAPGRLTSLKLCGKLAEFPQFVTELSGLEELCLSWTALPTDRLLGGLMKLRILKYLKLVEDELEPMEIQPELLPSLRRICLVSKRRPRGNITILPDALPYLVSLHAISQDIDGLCGIDIGCLRGLEQVALHSLVAPETKQVWQVAAKEHPNQPSLFFIDQCC